MPLLFKKKKYTCVGKNEDEVRDEFYEACREGKLDWIDEILTQNPDFDVNALTEDEECQQGYIFSSIALNFYKNFRSNTVSC